MERVGPVSRAAWVSDRYHFIYFHCYVGHCGIGFAQSTRADSTRQPFDGLRGGAHRLQPSIHRTLSEAERKFLETVQLWIAPVDENLMHSTNKDALKAANYVTSFKAQRNTFLLGVHEEPGSELAHGGDNPAPPRRGTSAPHPRSRLK
eukprot:2684095-Pleurochrysis_carterae.AAC.1